MRTTELVVEQVLTGLLVLLALGLPFAPSELPDWTWSDLIAPGAVVLGVSYSMGTVFDRFADTLLSRLEQLQRLEYAKKLDENRDEREKQRWADPFPEDLLRARAMRSGGDIGEWLSYLRTRIRIARSLTVFLPALTFSATFLLLRERSPLYEGWPKAHAAGLLLLPIIYALSFWETLHYEKPRTKEDKPGKKLPRTDDPNRDVLLEAVDRRQEPIVKGAASLVGLASIAVIAGWCTDVRWEVVSLLGAGATLTALSAWSWVRITATFMHFLDACSRARVGLPSDG